MDDQLSKQIRDSRVLMVGAGGIGCELLKNLVLAGFGTVELVDLDTIDVSNLNRQFLFQRRHVKQPKAIVAKESAAIFNPDALLVAHHANIKDASFSVSWFRSFELVFNALDNLEARRHVNQMCLAADVPLIDCGSAGFQGQVQVVQPGVTECYDCTPKQTPRTFPVCTIRSTPTQPIHAVVWAKSYLFTELFGPGEAAELDPADGSSAELADLSRETAELKAIRASLGSASFGRLVFEKVFSDDIRRLGAIADVWTGKNRQPPAPLSYDALVVAGRPAEDPAAIARRDRQVWTLAENAAVFEHSLGRLSAALLQARAGQPASAGLAATLTFDKDDPAALDFVTACANLRSAVFGIGPAQTKFDVKEMAGNIIPAVATTNASVAALGTLQALDVLARRFGRARSVFLAQVGASSEMFSSQELCGRSPACPACATAVYCPVAVDPARATVADLARLVRARLGYAAAHGPGALFSIATSAGAIVYDPDFEPPAGALLADFGVRPGEMVTVVDEDEDEPLMDAILVVGPPGAPAEGGAGKDDTIVLTRPVTIPRQPRKEPESDTKSETEMEKRTEERPAPAPVVDGEVIELDVETEPEPAAGPSSAGERLPLAGQKRRISSRHESEEGGGGHGKEEPSGTGKRARAGS